MIKSSTEDVCERVCGESVDPEWGSSNDLMGNIQCV
jgi:hypothetical protein